MVVALLIATSLSIYNCWRGLVATLRCANMLWDTLWLPLRCQSMQTHCRPLLLAQRHRLPEPLPHHGQLMLLLKRHTRRKLHLTHLNSARHLLQTREWVRWHHPASRHAQPHLRKVLLLLL